MLLVPKRVVGALAALRASLSYSAGRHETSIDLNCHSARWQTAKRYLMPEPREDWQLWRLRTQIDQGFRPQSVGARSEGDAAVHRPVIRGFAALWLFHLRRQALTLLTHHCVGFVRPNVRAKGAPAAGRQGPG